MSLLSSPRLTYPVMAAASVLFLLRLKERFRAVTSSATIAVVSCLVLAFAFAAGRAVLGRFRAAGMRGAMAGPKNLIESIEARKTNAKTDGPIFPQRRIETYAIRD